jgi:hypothetical protein
LIAYWKAAEIIAQRKKPHSIREELFLPTCKEIVRVILDAAAMEEVMKARLPNNTVNRRIAEMSKDMKCNVN